MPAIKSTSIRDLKNRISIYDVVSPVVSLKRAGSSFKGLSPFNNEKTPSFFVSPDKNLYKCFSSGKAGDIISFVMETERLTFTEAVESLARRFNVELEYESGGYKPEDRSLRQELFDLHELAAEHFRQAFLAADGNGPFIRTYWTEKRDFPLELATEFKIGLAEPDGGGLAAALLQRKFSAQAMRESGLFYARGDHSPSGYRPRFRGRLMIPIRDHQGRVIAFTARQLEITPKDDPSHEAKYINSPETPIFVKGQILFNLDRARMHVSETVPFLMVEGQLDALRCWQVGLKAAVAPQGTGITENQLSLLRRYEPRIDCLLDGDRAGQSAALRFLPLALKNGLEVRFLCLAAGDDPDSLLARDGTEAVEKLRAKALSAIAFAAQAVLPEPAASSAQEKAAACERIFAIIAQAESAVARSEYIDEISPLLGVSRQALHDDYHRFAEKQDRNAARRAHNEQPESPPPQFMPGHHMTVEEDILQLILHHEDLGKPLSHAIHPEWVDTKLPPGRLLNRFLAEFEHDLWPGSSELDELLETPEEKRYIASLLFEKPRFDDPRKIANDGLKTIFAKYNDLQIREIELEIARKQEKFDDELILLLKKVSELKQYRLKPPLLTDFP